MKTFRIVYTKAVEHIVELEAKTVDEAWKKIKAENFKSSVIWEREGNLTFNAITTEEIVRNIASNPK